MGRPRRLIRILRKTTQWVEQDYQKEDSVEEFHDHRSGKTSERTVVEQMIHQSIGPCYPLFDTVVQNAQSDIIEILENPFTSS